MLGFAADAECHLAAGGVGGVYPKLPEGLLRLAAERGRLLAYG